MAGPADRRVLVTGFGAFPGAPVNPTQALAAALRTARLPATVLETHVLPVTWAGTATTLHALIDRVAPDAVLMFGLARRSRVLRLETRAANAAAAHPDADGLLPPAVVPWPDGPAFRASRAALPPVLDAIRATGARVRLSADAGAYLCNAALWTALAVTDETTPVLFIHVPPLLPGGRLTPDGLAAAALAAIGALRLPD